MKNLSRNTAAVLVITLFTGLAVFSAVQLGARLFDTTEAGAQTLASPVALQQQGGGNGSGYGYGGGEQYADPNGQSPDGSRQYSDPYGESGSSSDSSGGTMTCPATGCSASSCHALQ